MMTKLIKINSLKKYIVAIERYPSTHFLYRGEGRYHSNRISAALRSYNTNNKKTEYPFEKMVNEFFHETSYR